MPRYKLREAREAAKLTQEGLAELIGAERKAVNYWERGSTEPREVYRMRIREHLDHNTDPDLFTNYPAIDICQNSNQSHQLSTSCQVPTNHAILESSDSAQSNIQESVKGFPFMDKLRRTIANAIGATLVGVNLQVIIASSIEAARNTSSVVVIDPEEYLDECTANIKECWQHVKTWQLDKAKALLNADKRILTRLATTPFPHQGLAASLAFESEIMQVMIATHELDYIARENHCAQAVRFGRLSGNLDFVIIALGWQGNTYTYCYRRPEKAIRILGDALRGLNSDVSPLNKSRTYIQLALAYAQDGNEIEAQKYIELANMTIPLLPELDPFSRLIGIRQSELDEMEGRVRLYLTEYTNDRNHAQLALDAFEKSLYRQVWSQGNRGRVLTSKADVARALGDMRECVTCLTEGFHVGAEIGSLKQICEASDVIGSMPDAWKQETAVQDLHKDITNAIVVARR